MSAVQQAKLALVDVTGLAKDALHIYVSLVVFFGACLIFRWKAWQVKPLLAVLLVAAFGEVLDLLDQYANDCPLMWGESAKDLVNTGMVPTILMLSARLSGIFRKDRAED
ncbi:hypothetical protein SZ64_04695 [Erythrobacter sp. SG61-1L]|uniref:hypothetical protein n=1 Tax=Erythrobacter sp. SG61-1L TaxID=1603897 RepID=UPI0006C92A66|nr:hypothetical protein [Erythrobacter sp. SG61-1L]KPL67462.1 hypothetical protein SZ64_04695 [Erythrobacter sp. SG61-1L]